MKSDICTGTSASTKPNAPNAELRSYYGALFRAWGPQNWWPARTRFEVVVGAYLTQNTSWTNVEKALQQMRSAGVLSLAGMRRTRVARLETLIRPAGYFRQKAKRLKMFVAFLDARYGGSLRRMFAQPTERLRKELLDLHGVGPETADSILLYAGNHPVFVVDAYTRRILARHGILAENTPYEEIRGLFEQSLAPLASGPPRAIDHRAERGGFTTAHSPSPVSTARRSALVQVYNEMHGLIVAAGKGFCLKRGARCERCPLEVFLAKENLLPTGADIA